MVNADEELPVARETYRMAGDALAGVSGARGCRDRPALVLYGRAGFGSPHHHVGRGIL